MIEIVQLLVVMTKVGHDVRRFGNEFSQGLHLSEAVALMESRQFTRGLQLLDFLDEALRPPSNFQKHKQDVLGSVGRDRLHVSFYSFSSSSVSLALLEAHTLLSCIGTWFCRACSYRQHSC